MRPFSFAFGWFGGEGGIFIEGGVYISLLHSHRFLLACVCRFMRTESLNHKFVYGSPITIGRLVSDVADSMYYPIGVERDLRKKRC